jgi:protein-S-isoprenylcysteine O-methyltransferase Ste14
MLWIYGRFSLGTTYSLLPQAKSIISTGMYSKISHPLYFSQMITLGGFILFMGQGEMWILFVFILCIQFYRIKQEEKILTEEFGNQYWEYKKSTWF